jgi:type I restriction enzyme, S subunit
MAGDWPILTVAECASSEPYSTQIGPFGDKIRAENYTPTGAPVLRGTNVNSDGRFYDDDFVFIESDLAEAEFGKFICEADDVILCHKGTLGKIGIIPRKSRFKKYIMGNSMMKVRCDRSKLEPLYLYYWLCSQDGQDYIFSRVSQVGVPQIHRPLTTLREASFPVPPLAEQKAIAAVLGALDDKIELNRRMNATLESMARALFQSWFVDFDPVRAKLDGRKPTGLDEATAALFPSNFRQSSQGFIPNGWTVEPIGEVVGCIGGSTPSTSDAEFWVNGSHPWATPKDLSALDAPVLVDTSRKITAAGISAISSGVLPAGTLLLSSRAPIGYLAITAIPVAIDQGVPALNWCRANMPAIEARATGTTFAEISKQNFRPLPIVLPSRQLMGAFTKLVAPFYEQIASNVRQSRTLAALRDSLLPKLLSGELRTQHA